MEFLNSIWLALSTENTKLINLLLIPFSFIEFYLLISLFTSILNNRLDKKNKCICVVILASLIFITGLICPTPYNVCVTYIIVYFITLFVFKLKPISTLFAILISLVTYTLVGSLFLNPYLKILQITYNQAEIVPIYRYL